MKKVIIFYILTINSICSFGQKWVSTNYDAHHLDYRDLGYPGVNEIEADNSRISALITGENGYIYGATSGKQSHLFLYDRYINKVRLLGKIPDAKGVYHTLAQDDDQSIYIGTGLNLLDEIPLTKDFPGGHRQIEQQLWKDIKSYHANFEGGHIYKYNPAKHDETVYLQEDNAALEDIGIVIPENSVYAMTIDQQRHKIYGITYPDAHFFSVDLATKKISNHGELLDTIVYAGPEHTWRSIPRSLVCLSNGHVVISGNDGLIEVFNPQDGKFTKTKLRIPGEYWESWNYTGYPVIEQFVYVNDSLIYGSTNDGFLFRLNMIDMEIIDLGKARLSRRVRGMVLGNDDQIYMICGELGEPCKLFSYNTKANQGYVNRGYISVDRSPYYQKRAYQFDTMTVGIDGAIFIGESDRRGKLFIYTPGASTYDGGLNPKNPR